MKKIEREKAILLRGEGLSLNEISKILDVAKSSVSLWVRDVELSKVQKKYLEEKGLFREAIEKRRQSRLDSEKAKRDAVIESAQKMVSKISHNELWLMGVMLYWAEGGKTQRTVRFANGDPRLIKIMMVFFRNICEVPEVKLRGYIHIHPHLDHNKAEAYWSNVTGIPLTNFYKTYRKPNISSQNKKDSLPYGTLEIYVHNADLFYKITGWAQGIFSFYDK